VVISEIRTRGPSPNGGSNEFVELFNATGAPVALDTTWSIEARSTTTASYGSRWTGKAGESIPAWGHFLITGTTYTETPAGDDALSNGISDANSVVLWHGSNALDAVCFYYNTTTEGAYQPGNGFTCKGNPVTNPHDDTTSTDTDTSIERKPGGTAGNCTDTGDNASDFKTQSPATPQSTASPPTP
jgi:hypothetical protein